ncbi:MAG TPA: methyltransferase domain-containing protein [Candidatus Hydrogenedentes bacterium]|nr:methyltransferase domain-containing protein [Candidatus Hydrogenedentota bacterium]
MVAQNAESVLAMARAFIESRVLLTGAELDVFTLLASPKSLDEAAAALKSDKRGTEILLNALAALGFLEKKDGRYCCPAEIVALLATDAPDSVLPMVLHSAGMWQRWSSLSDIVRFGKAAKVSNGPFEKGELSAFIYAMHVVGRHAADAIAAQANAESSRILLDVGGATGTYAEAFLKRYPLMRATVFDQPPVIKMAEQRLASSSVRDRITLVPGDFYTDSLPAGHDLVLLSAIIHQNSPEQNTALYKKCHDALIPGGRILIRDHVLAPDRTRPVGGALFAVNMLVATEGGNCYTFEDIQCGLKEAAFERIKQIQQGERMDCLVEAYKP